jgi:hypothetical protein
VGAGWVKVVAERVMDWAIFHPNDRCVLCSSVLLVYSYRCDEMVPFSALYLWWVVVMHLVKVILKPY